MIGKGVRLIKRKIDKLIMKVCSVSKVTSSLYYVFFNSSFKREHYAVLKGKVKHVQESKVSKDSYFLLIRNTHRLEKGLLMRPRKEVFAKEYIKETIDSFEGIWELDKCELNPQMKWFYDVLENYFSVCGNDQDVNVQHRRFLKVVNNQCAEGSVKLSSRSSTPYLRKESDRTSISFSEFYHLTKQRRSVRWFIDKLVPREFIDNAILAANQSPSACNRQPFEFRVFDDRSLVKELVDLPMGTKGYGQNIPVMIVLVGNLDAYFHERDRHLIYIDASLAAMSFMLALETMGLSSCSINWPDIEIREKKMETFLKLKAHQRPIMCIGVGYPDPEGMVAFSEKRPLQQIRKYNK